MEEERAIRCMRWLSRMLMGDVGPDDGMVTWLELKTLKVCLRGAEGWDRLCRTWMDDLISRIVGTAEPTTFEELDLCVQDCSTDYADPNLFAGLRRAVFGRAPLLRRFSWQPPVSRGDHSSLLMMGVWGHWLNDLAAFVRDAGLNPDPSDSNGPGTLKDLRLAMENVPPYALGHMAEAIVRPVIVGSPVIGCPSGLRCGRA